jgi:hypothetical protein
MSGAGVMRRMLAAALLLAAAQLVPLRAAHAQRRADARVAFAPAHRARVAPARTTPVSQRSDHTARNVTAIVIGGALGGVLGYHMVKNACVSCTENAPMYLGGTIGVLGGAAIGLMAVRSRDRED